MSSNRQPTKNRSTIYDRGDDDSLTPDFSQFITVATPASDRTPVFTGSGAYYAEEPQDCDVGLAGWNLVQVVQEYLVLERRSMVLLIILFEARIKRLKVEFASQKKGVKPRSTLEIVADFSYYLGQLEVDPAAKINEVWLRNTLKSNSVKKVDQEVHIEGFKELAEKANAR